MSPNTLPDGFTLKDRAHDSFEAGACIMEAVSWLNGEPWSDSPKCACDVIGAFLRPTNDAMDDETRQILLPLAPKLIGTRTTDHGVMQRRAFIAADWAVRYCAPAVLRSRGFGEHADKMEACAELVDVKTAEAGRMVAYAAYDADATYPSATSAAYAAYTSAAYASSVYAAYDADADAYAASASAAYTSSVYAAYDADARRKLYALVTREGITIAESAVRMVERMIEVTP